MLKPNDVHSKKPISINTRTVVAYWKIRQCYERLDKLGTLMNMSRLLLNSSYADNDINKKPNTAYAESAVESMQYRCARSPK